MLRTRLATAAVALPALWLIIEYLPPSLFATFIALVTLVGLSEYFAMAFPDDATMRRTGIGLGLLVAGAMIISGRPAGAGAALSVAVVGGLTLPLVRHADLTATVTRLGLLLLGVLYVGFFVPHMVMLRQQPEGWRWVLFTVYVAMGSDSGGYFTGRYLGHHKLMPAVSPGKTVEGAVGSVVGAMLIAMLCQLAFFRTLTPREALGIAVVVSLLAQFGDLCESALKRAFGAKDSGWIIPGHGGILDRLDSLLFPFVFAYYYALFARG